LAHMLKPTTEVLGSILSMVRNIFKILGCHEREDTTQKSIGKAKFTSAKGFTPRSLKGMHPRWKVHRGFI
jgi:hypothetical protein